MAILELIKIYGKNLQNKRYGDIYGSGAVYYSQSIALWLIKTSWNSTKCSILVGLQDTTLHSKMITWICFSFD